MSMPDQYLGDILNKYSIKNYLMTFIRHNENLTYKVIDSLTGKAYLLRIHRPFTNNFSGPQHSLEGLQSELQLLIHITEKTSLVVQTPIRSNSGDFIVDAGYEGDTVYCSLLQWIEGRDLKKEDVSDGDVIFKLGVQLGVQENLKLWKKHSI